MRKVSTRCRSMVTKSWFGGFPRKYVLLQYTTPAATFQVKPSTRGSGGRSVCPAISYNLLLFGHLCLELPFEIPDYCNTLAYLRGQALKSQPHGTVHVRGMKVYRRLLSRYRIARVSAGVESVPAIGARLAWTIVIPKFSLNRERRCLELTMVTNIACTLYSQLSQSWMVWSRATWTR
jgi:hypothetical protein